MDANAEIARRVVAHYRAHARDLPFRRTRDAYAIWVCEIMAQQTRLAVVIPYWERWLARFPTVAALAAAPLDDVLAHWAGLGYYARARALHKAAGVIVERHGGRLPEEVDALAALPGIGPYTAGAVASIAFGRRAAIVDGNVARIFARLFGIEDDVLAPATKREMWRLAGELVPDKGAGEFNQGLMDLGATICTPRSPSCLVCPLGDLCVARRDGRQAELPVARRKSETPVVEVAAAWIRDRRGRWLLCRRAPEGLFGGLWEFPEAAALELEVGTTPVAEHEQQLSHRRMRYRVYEVSSRGSGSFSFTSTFSFTAFTFTTRERPRTRTRTSTRTIPKPDPAGAQYTAARYFTPTEIAALGVSSATAALTRALIKLETDRWPIQTARKRSSGKGSRRSSRD